MKILTYLNGKHSPSLKLSLSVAVAVLLLAVTGALTAPPALAAELRVDNGIINQSVGPGEGYQHTFTVQSGSGEPVMQMLVEAAGFGQTLDGGYFAVPAGEDNYSHSAREFIADIDKPSFTLSPGPSGAQDVTVRIEVPQDIGDGGYYAIIYVHSEPSGAGQVGSVVAFVIPVVLTVGSTERMVIGEITDLTAREIEDGENIVISSVFENTGNCHYRARDRITMTDKTGKQVAEAAVPLTTSSIVPGYAHGFEASLTSAEGLSELPAGRYEVTSQVFDENDMVLDTKVLALDLNDDYRFPGEPGDGAPSYLIWIAAGLGVLTVVVAGAVLFQWGKRSGSKGQSAGKE